MDSSFSEKKDVNALLVSGVGIDDFEDELKRLGGVLTDYGWAFSLEKKQRIFAFCDKYNFHSPLFFFSKEINFSDSPTQLKIEKLRKLKKKMEYKSVKLDREISLLCHKFSVKKEAVFDGPLSWGEGVPLARQEEIQRKVVSKTDLDASLSDVREKIQKLVLLQQEKEGSSRGPLSLRFLKPNCLKTAPSPIKTLLNVCQEGKTLPFLVRGIVGMFVGSGGLGKTRMLVQLAISLVSNVPWLGCFPVSNAGKVFLVLGEQKEEEILRVFYYTVQGLIKYGLLPDCPDFLKSIEENIFLMTTVGKDTRCICNGEPTSFFQSIKRSLIDSGDEWSCIILDPASRFLGDQAETNNESATRFVELMEDLSLSVPGGPTVLFSHHMSKGGMRTEFSDQGAARGASAFTDGVRWQANIEKRRDGEQVFEDKRVFRVVKSNLTPPIYPICLSLEDGGVLLHEDVVKKKISPKEIPFGNYSSKGRGF